MISPQPGHLAFLSKAIILIYEKQKKGFSRCNHACPDPYREHLRSTVKEKKIETETVNKFNAYSLVNIELNFLLLKISFHSFRLESLGIRKLAGQAKLVGIFLSIGGAMILTFYKGEEINLWSTNINLAKHGADHATRKHALLGNQVLGSLLALAACVSFAIWYIIQVSNFPVKFTHLTIF